MAALPSLPTNANLTGALNNQSNNAAPNNNLSPEQNNIIQESQKPNVKRARFLRDAFNISEMFLALPMVANSFVIQADNIHKQANDVEDPGSFGHIASAFDSMSAGFKWFIRKYISQGKVVDDVKSNQSPSLTSDILRRVLHPNITKEFSALLFNTRRIAFNLLPGIFTVPSIDHDPLNPHGDRASATGTKIFHAYSILTSPLRAASSLFSLATTVPSHLLGSVFSYTGNEAAYKATRYFSRISELFTPILSNFSSLLSVAKAYVDSYVGDPSHPTGMSRFVTFGRYNVSWTNWIQGVFGSALSVPHFFGVGARLRDVFFEKDDDQRFKFAKNLKTIADNLKAPIDYSMKILNKVGLAQGDSSQDLLRNFEERVVKFMLDTDVLLREFFESVFNFNDLTRRIFSKIRPMDANNQIQAIADGTTVEFNTEEESPYSFGFIRKSSFFNELHEWLHPIQSMLMLLPNAMVKPSDPYISDNSKLTGSRLDKLLGINSMVLSLPNYLLYCLSTRVPQLMLKHLETKQRAYEDSIRQGDGEPSSGVESGMEAYHNMIRSLENLPILGTDFLASKLKSLNISEEMLSDETIFKTAYDGLDRAASDQEASIKASELVNASRIGYRTILERGSNEKGFFAKKFYAKRNEEGLTVEEVSRKKFYETIGNFKNIIGKIPVFGWVAAPLIEGFRSFYKVDTSGRRNRIVTQEQLANNANQLQKLLAQANQAAPAATAV